MNEYVPALRRGRNKSETPFERRHIPA